MLYPINIEIVALMLELLRIVRFARVTKNSKVL